MNDTSADTSTASFEDTLLALQEIVDALEAGNLPLSETISRFEEGARLADRCRKLVSDAELRITVLSETADELDEPEDGDDDFTYVPF